MSRPLLELSLDVKIIGFFSLPMHMNGDSEYISLDFF